MAMKIFILCLLCLSEICWIQCNEEAAKALHDLCVAETGVDESLIDALNNKVWSDDPKLKCYIKCIMFNIGSLSDDGTIDVEGTLSVIPSDRRHLYEPGVIRCGTVRGRDICETAYLTNRCYFDYNPEIHFMI